MNMVLRIFIFITIMNLGYPADAQESSRKLQVVFYNVQNLFDTQDDPEILDDEFTESGDRHWTKSRYLDKINHLYQTIVASGTWDPPDLIGLCEIENRGVLDDLVMNTPLSKYPYHIVHFDSQDERGIDVALLVRERLIRVTDQTCLRPGFAPQSGLTTRDVLHVKGVVGKDTLHIMVNHWPSRRQGIAETTPLRNLMAAQVRDAIDGILIRDHEAKILIMGDFNDEMHNESIQDILGVSLLHEKTDDPGLFYFPIDGQVVPGTYKYQGRWYHFDHFFFTSGLLNDSGDIWIDMDSYRIVAPDFLMMEDEQYLGIKPFPTYYGFQYLGGFSDHLPIRMVLITR